MERKQVDKEEEEVGNVAGKVEVGGHFNIFMRKVFVIGMLYSEGVQSAICSV